jgi:2-hydroxy-6-oxonona-2,4-dienedioate hydrolase
MTAATTGYVEQADGRLYYEVAGEGETVILGHAGFVDSGMWDDQWDAFAQRYHVVRYDLRGFGKSDPATGPRNRRNDLAHLLAHLQIGHAALVGCSMSGTIMLDFALEHPEMASALVIVSAAPSGFEMEGAPPPELAEMFPAAQQGDSDRVSELQIRLWIDGPTRQPKQVNPDVRRRAAAMNHIPVQRNTFFVADLQPFEPLAPPAIERLDTLQPPTLVLAGALDNAEIVRAANVMAAAIPGAQANIFTQSAHLPSMEQPEEFNQTVLDFLAGVG